jgi:hypothetical protein
MNQPGLRIRSVPSSLLLWFIATSLFSIASCAESSSTPGTCEDGLLLCGGTCVDTNADPDNCGECGQSCAQGQTCEDGECLGQGGAGGAGGTGGAGGGCGEGQTDCAGSCVNLQTDSTHCGSCGVLCASDRTCIDGGCVCPANTTECHGACIDLQSDVTHCGTCDQQCGPSQICAAGVCACNEGFTDCDGTCANLDVNLAHCGSCDNACSTRSFCVEGACTCIVGPYEDIGSTVPQTVTGTTVGGGSGYDLSCVAAGSTEVVYMFTASEDGTYTFDTAGSSYDTAIGVFTAGECRELGCNDDSLGSQSRVTLALATGDSVLVVLTGFDGAMGEFALNIGRAAAPVCPNGAIDPALPQTVTGNTGALGDRIAPSCGSAGSPDASYTFVAPHDGRFIFDTVGSTYNTLLEVRNGDCDGPSLGCNDDFGGQQSRLPVTLAAGQTVVVVVDGYAGAGGPFTLNVSEYTPPPCPAADLGSTVPQTVTGDTSGLENTVETTCGAAGGVDSAYSFTAPADALYVFDTFGTGWDTVLHAHDGSCSGPALACNDDSSGLQSQIRVLLTAGQTIVVVVDGYGTVVSGPYTLHVSQIVVPPCPSVDLGSTVPQTVTGTTAGGVDVLTPSCGGSGSAESTYSFTAPEDGTYVFDTFGSSFNTVLHIHDGSCSGVTLACNNDASGAQSRVSVDLTAGQTVVVVVDGYFSTSGSYVLNVSQFSGGGTCAAPIDLGSTVPQIVTGSTTAQLDSTRPGCGFSSGAPDTIYSFTAPEAGTYFFDTFGSSFNTILHVLDGSCAGPALGCNDDAGGPQSRLNVDLAADQTVLVVVDGYSGGAGDYVLDVNRFVGAGTCATPIDLGSAVPQVATGTTLTQPSSTSPTCGFSSSAPDVVYNFTAPADGTYIFDTFGSSFNTILHVLDHDCAGSVLACNDDAGGAQSRLNVELLAGQTVNVVVDGYAASTGDYVLSVNQFIGAGTCSTALDLGSTVPQTVSGSTLLQPNSVSPTCGFSSAPDVVYTFTAPSDGIFMFDTLGSSFDTVLHLRDADCAGSVLGCNDNAGSSQSRVAAALVSGQTVVVVVDGAGSSAGDFLLNVSRFDGTGTCLTPIDLGSTVPQTATGNTSLQIDSITPICGYSTGAPDMVFTFTAPTTGNYIADTFGSSFDTILHVRNGVCSAPSLVCNDDSSGLQSRVTMSLTAAQVVTIVVDGYGATSGAFTLHINPG